MYIYINIYSRGTHSGTQNRKRPIDLSVWRLETVVGYLFIPRGTNSDEKY